METGSGNGELQTWRQIAAYLNVSIRAAQTYARDRGLPVRHLKGEKTPVVASRAELNSWLLKNRVALHAAETEPDSFHHVEHDHPSTQKPLGDIGDQQNRDQRVSPHLRRAIGPIAVAVVLLIAGTLSWRWNNAEVAMINIDGPEIIARDSAGHELWRHLFKNGVHDESYKQGAFPRKPWVGDLDGNGHQEVLFQHFSDSFTSESTTLYCFGGGGKIKWSFVNTKVVRDSGGEIAPIYLIEALQVLPSLDGHSKLLAVASSRMTDQACQLALLDSKGRLVAEYWHPGHLYLMGALGEDRPGKARLIAAGVNDGEHRATLVVLNPYTMKGASTPSRMKDQRFHILDMPEAREELVILFPRSCLDRDEPKTMVSQLALNEKDILVNVAMSHHPDSNRSVFFEFSPDFRLKRAFLSTEYWQEHLRMEREGKLDHSWRNDAETLAAGVEYRRGN